MAQTGLILESFAGQMDCAIQEENLQRDITGERSEPDKRMQKNSSLNFVSQDNLNFLLDTLCSFYALALEEKVKKTSRKLLRTPTIFVQINNSSVCIMKPVKCTFCMFLSTVR